ncbi:MAG TPA: carbonic anhydrase, partial [Acidimicrobiales bacterium]|nr:carbonic anhydrase [Acidimicrobiales bacterium]
GAAAKRFALVTCMDSRIEPLVALGLVPGDAKILRNAGGRVTGDVLRSLVLATTYLDVVSVAVMHHTDCAMTKLTEAGIRTGMAEDQVGAVEGWDFLTMAEPDIALAADVAAVRGCAGLAAGVRVAGWRYDVGTGEIRQVVRP